MSKTLKSQLPPPTLLQPSSAMEIGLKARGEIVISTLKGATGHLVVLSLYKSTLWNLSPLIKNANVPTNRKTLDWSTICAPFREVAKEATYRYMTSGISGRKRPAATSVVNFFWRIRQFIDWVNLHGLRTLGEVKPIHCMAYVKDCRDRGLKSSSIEILLLAVEALYLLRTHCTDGMVNHPWPESSAGHIVGSTGRRGRNQPSTELIPDEILCRLFQEAKAIVDSAEELLDKRDRGELCWNAYQLNPIRTTCYFLLGIISGCRNHELASIEVGAIRCDTHDGESYCWLKGVSLKTYEGDTEWMVPELGARCVEVMTRWSAPYRARIEARLQVLDCEIRLYSGKYLEPLLVERDSLVANQNRLFLGHTTTTDCICSLSNANWTVTLKAFAKRAGVDWDLASHQLRRKFVASAAHHILGDVVYLKKHLKHRSIDMTVLYALNPKQEKELFDEILFAMKERKIAIVSHWMDDSCTITGGLEQSIKSFRRDYQLNNMISRKSLIEDTSDKVSIRSTGHSWCLTQGSGCGGVGLYEKTRCSTCNEGAIDDTFIPVYQALFEQNKELLLIANECGPGGQARIHRDIKAAASVLQGLGVAVALPDLSHTRESQSDSGSRSTIEG